MKKSILRLKLIASLAISVVLIAVFAHWVSYTTVIQSTSADGTCEITVRARHYQVLIQNYDKIEINCKNGWKHKTIVEKISNGFDAITSETENVYVFWDNNNATIVLLCSELFPRIITIQFGNEIVFQDITDVDFELVPGIFQKNGIDMNQIPYEYLN